MLMQAAPGLKVPMEGKPRDYVTDQVAVELPDTSYYLRRVACGDLVAPHATPATPGVKPSKTTSQTVKE